MTNPQIIYDAEAAKGVERVKTEAGERIPFTDALALAGILFDPAVHYDPIRNEPPRVKPPPSPPTDVVLASAKALVSTSHIEDRKPALPPAQAVTAVPVEKRVAIDKPAPPTREYQEVLEIAARSDEDRDGLGRRGMRIIHEVRDIIEEATRVRDQHRVELDFFTGRSNPMPTPPSLINAIRAMVKRLPESVHPDPAHVLIREASKGPTGDVEVFEVTIGELRAWLQAIDAVPQAPDLERFACKVCGAKPERMSGLREHSRGCYQVSADGGGTDSVDIDAPKNKCGYKNHAADCDCKGEGGDR